MDFARSQQNQRLFILIEQNLICRCGLPVCEAKAMVQSDTQSKYNRKKKEKNMRTP